MIIKWYGQACFRVQSGKTIIVIDPFAKSIGLQPPRGEVDIVMVTHDHDDHNNIHSLQGEFFLIDGPGEFEVKGVKVMGISSFHDTKEGNERGLNTIYSLKVEDIHLVHLGDFGQDSLTDEQLDALGEVDVLMVPVGGIYTIDGTKAASIVHQVEPKLVIPMHYKISGLSVKLNSASQFLKELGQEGTEMEKLVLKKKDLNKERMEIVLLSHGSASTKG